ncbi:hypothetical protein [Rhodonellum sp.]|uniref:phage tail protein n=1 Tax=Rhodonellum sp. TaxID=2231180 RepID=UPI00271E306C|nr:hypothetical protein [Rhodonellum sp.]MDO9554520.1 hypothetical protein [Rhodonellum sp.]
MDILEIKRDGVVLHSVKIGIDTVLTNQLMGQHKVDARWASATYLDLTLGDYIEVGAEKFYLNKAPNFEKKNNFTYAYEVSFEGEAYKLFNKIMMDEGAAEFGYFGDLHDFMLLIQLNINSIDAGWTIDVPEGGERRNIDFSEESCRQALNKICEEFGVEYRLVQREIIVRPDVGFTSLYTFEYGRGKGLYSLQRDSVEEKGVVTRLYGFGAQKNLAFDYRDGARRLVFQTGDPAVRYIEANTELYGIKEGTVTFEDIYPRRTGSVTASTAINSFSDDSIDFDLNAQLLEGTVAKVVFKSGALNGYQFDIRSYNHTTKTVVFNDFSEVNDYVLPNDLNFPEPGDQYTFVDIKMPQSYIDAAELELLEATQEHHIPLKSPRVNYTLTIDEKYIRTGGVEIACGMKVSVNDSAIGLNEMIRIYSITYPIVKPSAIVAQIADNIPYTVRERITRDLGKLKGEYITIDRTREENYRDAVRRLRKLSELIYDPDGYFNIENIRPGSIETLSLTVGANSQNFGLNGVEIEANYEGDPNSIRISGGQLVHFEIEIPGLGYVWEMDPSIINDLVPASSYYLYARCNRNALSGTWKISTVPIRSEEEPGFYNFWVGILYPVENGRRYFMFTKGMTFIVGDTITTGTIKSLDGLNYFNLNQSTFNIGSPEQGLDWNVSNENALTIRGAVITNAIFANDGVIQNLRVSSLKTANEGKRLEILADDGGDPATPLHNLKFYDADGNLSVTLDTAVDSSNAANPSAGLKIEKNGSSRQALVTQNGIMSSGSYLTDSALPTSQHLGSILGILREKFASAFGIRAGVIGFDSTDPAVGNPSYGGWFNTLFAGGLNIGVKQVTANYTATLGDTLISCYNSTAITISLPASPKPGKVIYARTNMNQPTQINGNGNVIYVKGPVASIAVGGTNYSRYGRMHQLIWDGTYWLYNAIVAVGGD